MMPREGQWVRVRPEVPITGGMHGTVVRANADGGAMLRFFEQPGMLTFEAGELTDEVTCSREQRRREIAQAELDDLVARTAG